MIFIFYDILFILPVILPFFFGVFCLSNMINNKIRIYILLIIEFILLATALFQHYLEYTLLLFIGMILIFLAVFCSFIYENKSKVFLINLFIPVISIILFFNSDISYNIALKIELHKAKNRLEEIIVNKNYEMKNNNYKIGSIKSDDGLYAFVFNNGFSFHWIAIVYDISGLLENGILIFEYENSLVVNQDIKDKYENDYIKITNLFGGKLYSIKKLEENWFLCVFQ
jgi:hypothetical protein